jgi:hypothetical protein
MGSIIDIGNYNVEFNQFNTKTYCAFAPFSNTVTQGNVDLPQDFVDLCFTQGSGLIDQTFAINPISPFFYCFFSGFIQYYVIDEPETQSSCNMLATFKFSSGGSPVTNCSIGNSGGGTGTTYNKPIYYGGLQVGKPKYFLGARYGVYARPNKINSQGIFWTAPKCDQVRCQVTVINAMNSLYGEQINQYLQPRVGVIQTHLPCN